MSIKIITVGEDILGANDDQAELNRKLLDSHKVFTINIMSSPGAGKTSTIMGAITTLKDRINVGVIEGDVASAVDAEKINAMGIPVVQINTQGGCHLDANMVRKALDDLPLEKIDLLFIENVGNLICPNAFALGEDTRILIASTPEGDDKPYKYPAMFTDTDVVLLNKIDLLPYLDFNPEAFRRVVTGLNLDVAIFPYSCKTGEGMDTWLTWLESSVQKKKNA
ncbi:MAG: hydrogenase nickel incorporation protein HypB [Dehalococcoidales bacterium]|nr:hydrogenase nickel incorporation protein HypB [Dehalococcoidales bacterium]